MSSGTTRGGARVQEFVPFDDRWFDDGLPGPLVPLPMGCLCVHDADGVFHWIPEGTLENVISLPLRSPSLAAVPALSSST